jgi:Uncharacterised protein family (UPF0175)
MKKCADLSHCARWRAILAGTAAPLLTISVQRRKICHMDVTIHIPDDLAARLGTAVDLPRRVLEAFAVEEFRLGHLTPPELRRLLGLATRQALDTFLKAHEVYISYTVDDLDHDRDDLRRLGFWPLIRLVVADTSPLNYLVLIGQVEILPALFEKVFVPQVVQNELRHDEAPESVRRWIAAPPSWLEVVPQEHESDEPDLLHLDDGERAAILLAIRIGADLLMTVKASMLPATVPGIVVPCRQRWGQVTHPTPEFATSVKVGTTARPDHNGS